MKKDKVCAIIVAGGVGSRIGEKIPKQFLKINNKEIIKYTLDTFSSCEIIDSITIVCHKDYIDYMNNLIKDYSCDINVVSGGRTRQESVYIGLKSISESRFVLIHDAVRCLVTLDEITKLYQKLIQGSACTLGVRVKDTLKKSDNDNKIISDTDRNNLWHIQTPQCFETHEILTAHEYAISKNIDVTDDTSLYSLLGKKVEIVEGSSKNIKITTKEDIEIASLFLKEMK